MKRSKKQQPLHREQDDLMRSRGFLPVPEVAQKCGVTRATVDLWMRKHIKFTRVGMRIYIQRKSLEAFLGPDGAKMLDSVT